MSNNGRKNVLYCLMTLSHTFQDIQFRSNIIVGHMAISEAHTDSYNN